MNSLVSIVIPTFNRAHLLGETLDSILAQTYQNWECIVIDDGSTDYTPELVEFYRKKESRIYYFCRPNGSKGANTCRNYGFKLSKGEYINWFDDDDLMIENFLERKMLEFVKNDNLNLVICSGFLANEKLEIDNLLKIDPNKALFSGILTWDQQIITNSVMFRKSFLENKNLFDPSISRGQEIEFFSRIFFKLPERLFRIIEEPLFLYRQHDQTVSTKDLKYIKKNKTSQSYIFTQNLKRSIEINDLQLAQFNFKELVKFFFKGIENDHLANSKMILKNLVLILHKRNRKLSVEILFFGFFLLILKRGSYKLERRWRLSKLQ